MKIFLWVFLLGLIGIGVSFSILNAQPVTLHYYLGTKQIPLSLLLFCHLASGLFLGLLFNLKTVVTLRLKNKSLAKKLNTYEQEILKLRTLSHSKDT